MKTRMISVSWRAAAFLMGLLVLEPMPSWADTLEEFAGFTRPGYPASVEGGKDVRPADFPKDGGEIGATVYFKVFERGDGNPGDPWGTGIKDMDRLFNTGHDLGNNTSSPRLDRNARYLYLYQVVNDSKRPSVVRTTTIRLIVEPQYITSWGWFAANQVADRRAEALGVSFTLEEGNQIVPASNGNMGADKREYQNPSPPFPAPPGFGFRAVGLAGPHRPVALGEDIAVRPERVELLGSASFEGRPYPTQGRVMVPNYGDLDHLPWSLGSSSALTSPLASSEHGLGTFDGYSYFNINSPIGQSLMAREHAYSTYFRSPAVRAYWLEEPLKPGEGSAVFGFTSNLPPTFADVRVRGGKNGLEKFAQAPRNPKADVIRPKLDDLEKFLFPLEHPGAQAKNQEPKVNEGPGEPAMNLQPKKDPNVRAAAFDDGLVFAQGSGSAIAGGVLAADGTVPTPVGGETGRLGGTTGGISGLGSLGAGYGGVGSSGGGPGGGIPGFGGGLGSALGSFPGGGGSTGGGSGGGTGTTGTAATTGTTANQQQQQQQQQQQGQNSGGGGCSPTAVPEPAAIIAVLLGLPVVYFFARRPKPLATEPLGS